MNLLLPHLFCISIALFKIELRRKIPVLQIKFQNPEVSDTTGDAVKI